MSYEIKDSNHKIIINLTTNITDPSELDLAVYRNNTTTPYKTYYYNNGKFVIPTSDFSVGDTITKMELVYNTTIFPWETHEGVKVLVNGEETNTTVDANGQFKLTFPEHGEYDIQAVYLGNKSNKSAYTEKKHFQVKQPDIDEEGDPENDGEWGIRFSTSTIPTFTYKDSKELQYILTKGGVPVSGKTVEVVNPYGANSSNTTDAQGKVKWTNGNWKAGKYRLGALFYNPDTGKVITSAFRTVEIKKGTPTWTDNAENNTTFYVGGKYKATLKYRGSPITNTKIDVYVNGKKTTLTTSAYGVVVFPFKAKGTYALKLVYKGSDNLNQATINKKFTVVVN